MNRTCSIPDCLRPFEARGYCRLHYRRFMKHGDPLMVGKKSRYYKAGDTKTCNGPCQELKPVEDFYLTSRGEYYFICKVCQQAKNLDVYQGRTRNERRAQHLRYTFHLSWDDYLDMLERQQHSCASCRTVLLDDHSTHVDHDRCCCPGNNSCGKCVRGILCSNCNTASGLLRDDPLKVKNLLDYLLNWEAKL